MTTSKPTNGWRNGRDPVQRWLRIGFAILCMILFAVLILDPQRAGDYPTLTLIVGPLLLILGYEGAIKLPDLLHPPGKKEEDEK